MYDKLYRKRIAPLGEENSITERIGEVLDGLGFRKYPPPPVVI